MPRPKKEEDPRYQDWWDEKPDKEQAKIHQQCLQDYIAFHDADPEHLKFGVDLVK